MIKISDISNARPGKLHDLIHNFGVGGRKILPFPDIRLQIVFFLFHLGIVVWKAELKS